MEREQFFKERGIPNQTALAKILGDGDVTPRSRVKAHRIWHGSKPNSDDMAIIFSATDGKVSANDFYQLPKLNGHKKRSRKQ